MGEVMMVDEDVGCGSWAFIIHALEALVVEVAHETGNHRRRLDIISRGCYDIGSADEICC